MWIWELCSGANPTHMEYSAMQEVLKEIRKDNSFHWAGAYDLSGNLLDVDDKISKYYQDVYLKLITPNLKKTKNF